MIDLHHLRADPDHFRQAWAHRQVDVDVDALLQLDGAVREAIAAAESAKAAANAKSKEIAQAARRGDPIDAVKEEARRLGEQAKGLDAERDRLQAELEAGLLMLPNPCLADVPVGPDESGNEVVDTWGEPRERDFAPRPHWELGEALGVLDLERGAKVAGSGFPSLRGLGARLSRALVNWFLDTHVDRNGYTEVTVPYLVRDDAMRGTGQLPKFEGQFYRCSDDDLVLIPTAEVPVTNLHAGEILDADCLPLRFCSHTPCFRREAGAAGVGTRGMTRVHQFDKVELVWLTTPERSRRDLLSLRGHAEALLRELGLHYRVLALCTGDTGFSAAQCFDLEVWSPGTGTWLEVSSCSTFTDFQARRARIRYRAEPKAKPELLHTLNGSALALPRVIIGIIEQYQNADGSIDIPEPLRPYMGGRERIEAVG